MLRESVAKSQLNHKTMDKQTLKQFREDFQENVKALEDKYNASIVLGNIRYGENQFTSKLTFTEVTEGVPREDAKWIESLRIHGHEYGLDEEDYGTNFTKGADEYEVLGIKPKARKYPIVGRNVSTGKLYKFTQRAIQTHIR